MLELQGMNLRLDTLLQDFFSRDRIRAYGDSSWSSKAAPVHHTATMFHCCYDVSELLQILQDSIFHTELVGLDCYVNIKMSLMIRNIEVWRKC